MTVTSTETGGMVGSFLLLRRAIGWIGTLLPIVVIAGDAAFSSGPLPNSLSDYYYTPMRNILVGALCVLGVFLLLYDVSVRVDRWITNAAGIGVLGVAFLPGSPPVPHLTTSEEVIGNLHVFFASIAFLGLAATMWRFAYAVSDGPGAPPPSPSGLRLLQGQRLRHARLRHPVGRGDPAPAVGPEQHARDLRHRGARDLHLRHLLAGQGAGRWSRWRAPPPSRGSWAAVRAPAGAAGA